MGINKILPVESTTKNPKDCSSEIEAHKDE